MMITKWRTALVGLIAGAAAGFAPAYGQVIEAVDAEQLETALNDAGLSSTILSDSSSGAPVAHGSAGPFTFFCEGDVLLR